MTHETNKINALILSIPITFSSCLMVPLFLTTGLQGSNQEPATSSTLSWGHPAFWARPSWQVCIQESARPHVIRVARTAWPGLGLAFVLP